MIMTDKEQNLLNTLQKQNAEVCVQLWHKAPLSAQVGRAVYRQQRAED